VSGWVNAADSLSALEARRAAQMERDRKERIARIVAEASARQFRLLVGDTHEPLIDEHLNRRGYIVFDVSCRCGWGSSHRAYTPHGAEEIWREHVEAE